MGDEEQTQTEFLEPAVKLKNAIDTKKVIYVGVMNNVHALKAVGFDALGVIGFRLDKQDNTPTPRYKYAATDSGRMIMLPWAQIKLIEFTMDDMP